MKIQKKIFSFFFGGGGGGGGGSGRGGGGQVGGVRVDGNGERGRGGRRVGCQGGCERRRKVFVKIQKKKKIFRGGGLGGSGWGGGPIRGWSGGGEG